MGGAGRIPGTREFEKKPKPLGYFVFFPIHEGEEGTKLREKDFVTKRSFTERNGGEGEHGGLLRGGCRRCVAPVRDEHEGESGAYWAQ